MKRNTHHGDCRSRFNYLVPIGFYFYRTLSYWYFLPDLSTLKILFDIFLAILMMASCPFIRLQYAP